MPPASQYAPLTQREEEDDPEGGGETGERQPLQAQQPTRGGGGSLRSLCAVPHYWKLFAAGSLFDGSRASLLFLTSLYVTQATGSPRFVQLTGVCLNLMLLFGPLFGIISDRYDRRRTVVFLLAAMAALTFSVSAGLAMGQLPWQLIYPVCIFCGVANVLDTTNRPALIFDLLHAQGSSENLSNAMALRSMGAGVGGALGVWMVGVVVELAGVWLGFAIVGVQMTVAMLLLCTVPSQPPARKKNSSSTEVGKEQGSVKPSVSADLKAGLWLAYTDTRLASILSVTIIANLLFFSHTPILQLLAVELGVSSDLAALLMAMQQAGRLFSSVVFLCLKPSRLGLWYSCGAFLATCTLPVLTVPSFGIVFGAELFSSFSSGFFGSTQSTLVMTAVPDEMRGRAMGLLTLSIGVQPIGMFCLGELAEGLGVRPALLVISVLGVVAHTLSQLFLPQARRMNRQ